MSEEATDSQRPAPFAPGLQIGMHLTLERFLSTGPHRAFYLANNFKPRWYTRICWACGHKHNPTTAESCVYCQTPLRARRFLLSARWGQDVRPFHAFASLRLKHQGLASPIVLYELGHQVLSFYEIADEAMLVDEPFPLHPRTLLAAAWTLAGGLHHLHRHGIALAGIGPEHVLVHREGARLFDLDVAEVRRKPIAAGDPAARRDVCALGALLARLVPLDQPELLEFFGEVEEDVFPGALAFQREIRSFARESPVVPATLGHAVLSVVGRRRTDNEDSWGWKRLPQADLYVVADGMGGWVGGEQASALAVQVALDSLTTLLPHARPADPQALFDSVFLQANEAVRSLASDQSGPMGTTLVAAVVWRDRTVSVAHLGDSRAYRMEAGRLVPITDDHSMVAAMVASGTIDREQARTHPRNNVLLQYLGNPTTPEPDVTTFTAKPGDQILLCSDGLWGELPEARLQDLLRRANKVRKQVRGAVQAALDEGGRDNVTALLVDL
ncbi:MAG: serine/threonine-protein phosphatase [Myxococcales bacterium]|nr:serine/threonine-protein phosphatase [Myxococcales bacterium]